VYPIEKLTLAVQIKSQRIMKSTSYLLILVTMAISCSPIESAKEQNPFFTEFDTPYGLPPFDLIKTAHFLPAFEKGIEEQKLEIEAITNNAELATFENTIEALELSGAMMSRINGVFYNFRSSLSSEELQEVAQSLSPVMSAHADDILLNAKLFERVNAVYRNRESLHLSREQQTLLEKTYKRFVRGGALLDATAQERLRAINEELSMLSLKYGDNVLAETNNFSLLVDDRAELSGIPQAAVDAAAQAAADAGEPDKWLFTLHRPSFYPVLTFADNRKLREYIHTAYFMRGDNDNEFDNKDIAAKIVALRVEKAQLLGYSSHADFVLEETMAKTPENVQVFLNELMDAARPMSQLEAANLQNLIHSSDERFKLEPWDWAYYAELLRKEKYDLDEAQLRPYFKLENVRDGIFELCKKLWGITFEERFDLPKYHADVQVFEVKDDDGMHIGILYKDFFPRGGQKQGGAWMSSFREQSYKDGKKITPIVTTSYNFTPMGAGKPALLSWEEVRTMFHEMGHALHGLLSDVTYESLSGTNVPRDFVELPSQIMEHWASRPEMLEIYAKHYETGEVIPFELVEKIIESGTFNQGFTLTEFISAALLDMDWHSLTDTEIRNVRDFENASLKNAGLLPEIIVRYRTTYFNHIFVWGYSAGYYSYYWSEVLDSDAFELFKEKGVFDSETAGNFRKHILAKGGTDDPMTLYVAFRGQEPDKNALLRNRGILK
jgi:peptidyl-dipeptidase Dcp